MRRSLLAPRALRLVLVPCAILAIGLVFSGAQAWAAGGEPTIVSESVSGVSEHDATLEATIDPDGLETTYAFWLGHEVCTNPVVGYEKQCYISVVGPLGEGHIAAGVAGEAVSAMVTSLEADTPYVYTVAAVSTAGHVLGAEKQFRTLAAGGVKTEGAPLPPPENKPTPFEPPTESWIGKSAAEGAARESARAKQREEEREAANKPPAATPLPKGEWCGEEGVTCESSEVSKPKPKTAAQLRAEKLVMALKACKKDHLKTRRAQCAKQARRKYRSLKKP